MDCMIRFVHHLTMNALDYGERRHYHYITIVIIIFISVGPCVYVLKIILAGHTLSSLRCICK